MRSSARGICCYSCSLRISLGLQCGSVLSALGIFPVPIVSATSVLLHFLKLQENVLNHSNVTSPLLETNISFSSVVSSEIPLPYICSFAGSEPKSKAHLTTIISAADGC